MVDFALERLKSAFKAFFKEERELTVHDYCKRFLDLKFLELETKEDDVIIEGFDEDDNHTITPTIFSLSEDQDEALRLIQNWMDSDSTHFILRGYAGTGKTFILQQLKNYPNIIYSAPTNKAAKVLSKVLKKPTKTTFSLFGLRLEHDEDELILKRTGQLPYFPQNTVIVIDEASMVGTLLFRAVEEVREKLKLKILYVGDPLQLPPVKELRSPSWQVTKDPLCKFTLKKVMRYDNQLLKLATNIRNCITEKDWNSPLVNDNDGTQGVFLSKSQSDLEKTIKATINSTNVSYIKVIAWRNKTVDRYNALIRKHLGFMDDYNVGDSILLAEPIEIDDQIIAHTDDEFIIKEVKKGVKLIDGNPLDVYHLLVEGDQELSLNVPVIEQTLRYYLSLKADKAMKLSGTARKEAWSDFWKTKSKFNLVRYGYALTAHRAQGSTYDTCFVDQQDILANPTSREAYRCLYVACTRASHRVYSF